MPSVVLRGKKLSPKWRFNTGQGQFGVEYAAKHVRGRQFILCFVVADDHIVKHILDTAIAGHFWNLESCKETRSGSRWGALRSVGGGYCTCLTRKRRRNSRTFKLVKNRRQHYRRWYHAPILSESESSTGKTRDSDIFQNESLSQAAVVKAFLEFCVIQQPHLLVPWQSPLAKTLEQFIQLTSSPLRQANPSSSHGAQTPLSTQNNLQQPVMNEDSIDEIINYCENLQSPAEMDEKEERDKKDKLEHDDALNGLHSMSNSADIDVYVVPQYQDGHNPNLPLSLQQQLAGMSPRDFLTHVMTVLSLEQREALMCDEAQRRRTFLVNWPHTNNRNLSGNKMAAAGLFALGNSDHVQCAFCRGRLHHWSSEDVPMVEHARLFNFCRFVKGLSSGNIEYRSPDFNRSDLQHITQFGATSSDMSSTRRVDSDSLGISTLRASAARYAPIDQRRRTYARWPERNAQSPERLCEAGFFYIGFEDHVRCFFCAGGLKQWSDDEDPWEEHAKWFPNCVFLINSKGKDYIDEVHARVPSHQRFSFARATQMSRGEAPVQTRSAVEQMKSCCMELGHSAQAIDQAMANNDGPFADIKELIDAIYDLEEDEVDGLSNVILTSPERPMEQISESAESDQQIAEPAAAVPAELNGTASRDNRRNCKVCEVNSFQIVPATHVALPCGHLIYCDPCKTQEARKSTSPDYTSTCPVCGTSLNGTIRVWFA